MNDELFTKIYKAINSFNIDIIKKIITKIIFLNLNAFCQKSEILAESKVDERVELLSIVFRLAGNREYCSKMFPNYVQNIEEYFTPFKYHELIIYTKNKIRAKGINYDAVMSMAISITEDYPFQPLIPFTSKVPEERWGKKSM